eukprot:13423604-Alexandrium_andersonii.AAC.1
MCIRDRSSKGPVLRERPQPLLLPSLVELPVANACLGADPRPQVLQERARNRSLRAVAFCCCLRLSPKG